jgi:hypothetical protein
MEFLSTIFFPSFEVLKSFEQNCLSIEWKRQKTEHPKEKEKKEFSKIALKIIERWRGGGEKIVFLTARIRDRKDCK